MKYVVSTLAVLIAFIIVLQLLPRTICIAGFTELDERCSNNSSNIY